MQPVAARGSGSRATGREAAFKERVGKKPPRGRMDSVAASLPVRHCRALTSCSREPPERGASAKVGVPVRSRDTP
jgi:hypothetical protein